MFFHVYDDLEDIAGNHWVQTTIDGWSRRFLKVQSGMSIQTSRFRFRSGIG